MTIKKILSSLTTDYFFAIVLILLKLKNYSVKGKLTSVGIHRMRCPGGRNN
jgi:hypothetical protein